MSVNNFSEIIVLHIDLQLFSYMFKVLLSTSLNWLSICAIIISSFVVVDDEDVDITLSVFIVFKLVVFILLHVTELFISFVLLFVFVLLLI
jgi:hypothetical protein